MAVCSSRQAKTEQKRDEENCTLIDEILVRTVLFLGAFEKLRKQTISIVMGACPSVRMEHFGHFLEIWHFTIYEIMQRKTEFINMTGDTGIYSYSSLCVTTSQYNEPS